jgi:hypothetical protein
MLPSSLAVRRAALSVCGGTGRCAPPTLYAITPDTPTSRNPSLLTKSLFSLRLYSKTNLAKSETRKQMVVFAHSFTYVSTFIFLAAFAALVPLPELWSFFLPEESFSFCTDPGSWGRDEKCE